MRYLRTLLLGCLLAVAALTVASCHTMEGMAQDLEQISHAIQDALN